MIYFLFGSDTYRSKEEIKKLILKNQNFEEQKIDGEKIEIDEFKSKIKTNSLFNNKQLFVIKNATNNKNQKEITVFLEKLNSDLEDILIFWEDNSNKKTSLYKFLLKQKSFEFSKLKGIELKKWIEKFTQKQGGKIDRDALEELLLGEQNNLWGLINEINKLLAYNKNITLENVKKLILSKFDDKIFNLTDAIGSGNKIRAINLINKQLLSDIDPLYILSMIVRQFRILIQIKEQAEKNIYPNYNLIAKELNLHPFVVQKTISQIKKYSFTELKYKYNKLDKIDLRLKSTKIPAEILFDQLVLN